MWQCLKDPILWYPPIPWIKTGKLLCMSYDVNAWLAKCRLVSHITLVLYRLKDYHSFPLPVIHFSTNLWWRIISWVGNILCVLAWTGTKACKFIVTHDCHYTTDIMLLGFTHYLAFIYSSNQFTHLNVFSDIFIQLLEILESLVENLQGRCAAGLYSHMDLPLHGVRHCVATELHSRAAMREGWQSALLCCHGLLWYTIMHPMTLECSVFLPSEEPKKKRMDIT